MRTLTLELNDSESGKTVRNEIGDTAIKQCLYGRPFDLLAEVMDLGEKLNKEKSNE